MTDIIELDLYIQATKDIAGYIDKDYAVEIYIDTQDSFDCSIVRESILEVEL